MKGENYFDRREYLMQSFTSLLSGAVLVPPSSWDWHMNWNPELLHGARPDLSKLV